MGKSSKNTHGATGSTNLLLFEPEKIVIVQDESHPLYDERIHMPLDEALVLNIMHHGVLEPVIVRRNPETSETEIVDGRQRVRATREANERLRAQGRPTHLVPAVVRKGSDASQFGVMISTNEIRQQDNPMVRARKMVRALEMGQTEDQVAVLFGVSTAWVKQTTTLLEASAPVRKAVESGTVTVTDAIKIAKLPADEQKVKLEELLVASPKEPGKRRPSKPRDPSKPKVHLRSPEEIAAMRDRLVADDQPVGAEILRWVLCEPGASVELDGDDSEPVETVVELEAADVDVEPVEAVAQ